MGSAVGSRLTSSSIGRSARFRPIPKHVNQHGALLYSTRYAQRALPQKTATFRQDLNEKNQQKQNMSQQKNRLREVCEASVKDERVPVDCSRGLLGA